MLLRFPGDFLWGAATAAAQIEGAAFEDGKGPSIWDVFSRIPGATQRGETPDMGCDSYHHLADDIRLMKNLGLQTYRFSFSWPRIFPEGTGRVNQKGLDYYRALLDALHENGIVPNATMYHWDLPYWLSVKGGFGNRDIVQWFVEYAQVLLEAFGRDIPLWATFNEPIAVYAGYAYGFFAPGIRDERYARQCVHNLLVCHGKTVQLFRDMGLPNAKIGIVVDIWPHFPARPDCAEDIRLAESNNEITGHGMFLNPLFLGGYSDIHADYMRKNGLYPQVEAGDFETIAQPLDFYGLNFYNGLFDRAGVEKKRDGKQGGNFQDDEADGYYAADFHPECILDALRLLRDKYHLQIPIYITENGYGVENERDEAGYVRDEKRIAYLAQILRHVHRAIEEGIPVRGYYVWSLMDNYEWSAGYSKKYGIAHVDFNTQARTLKESGKWYAKVIARGAVELPD